MLSANPDARRPSVTESWYAKSREADDVHASSAHGAAGLVSRFRDTWRVRTRFDDVEIELDPEGVGFAASETSRDQLGTLLWMLEGGDPDVERVLLEVYARLSGLSLMDASGRSILDHGSSFDARVTRGKIKHRLEFAAYSGLLIVRRVKPPAHSPPPPVTLPPSPKLSPARPPRPDVLYRYPLTVIDDTEQPVAGANVKFDLDGTPKMTATSGAGDATIEWVVDTPGTVRILDLSGLRKRLKPRWKEAATSTAPASARQRVDRDAVEFPVTSNVRTTIVLARPGIVRTRLIGAFFDSSKSFLLPSAIAGVRGMRRQYDDHPRATVLVVGHTDTAGQPDYNETLSLERADALAAFLKNDVDPWEAWFGDDQADEKRWGPREVQLMLSVLPERADDPFWTGSASGRDDTRMKRAVRAFQQFSNDTLGTSLDVDGEAGPKTRHEIVKAYMALQDTTLPDGTEVVAHGCGENFPAEPTPDAVTDPDNRRVEIFLFDGPVDPPPAGDISRAGATDYPEWLHLLEETIDFTGNLDDDLNSAVRLLSVASASRTFPKPSWIPILADISARLVADPSLHVLVVGNCDETRDDGLNRALSLARANAVRALLLQDADTFRAQFDGAEASANWDWEEIQWMLSAILVDGQPCYAGYVDGQRGDAVLSALQLFQLANDLEPGCAADDITLRTLIEQYQVLLGEQAPEPDQVEVAAGGAGLVPRTFGPASAHVGDDAYHDRNFAGFRRVELFLSTKVFDPAPESLDNVSGPDHPSYEAWCKATVVELPGQTTLPVTVQIVDRFGIAAPSGGSVSLVADDGTESSVASLSPGARGITRLDLPMGVYAVRFGEEGSDQTMTGLHVRQDEVGGVVVRLREGVLTDDAQ